MKKQLLFIFLIFSSFHYGYSDESVEDKPESFISIRNIIVTSKGMTQPQAVLLTLEIKEGEKFTNWDDFLTVFNKQNQILENTRLFKDYSISYSIEENPEGTQLVDIFVILEESFNLVILPYVDYNSNEGISASLRLRDYNFLGGMGPLGFNINYKYYTGIPGGGHEFSVESFYERDLALFNHYFHFKGGQDFFIFSRDPDGYNDSYYLKTSLELSTHFDTTLHFSDGTPIYYNLKLKTDATYNFSKVNFLSEERRRLGVGFSHGLSFKNVSWEGNFRNGYFMDLENLFDFNFLQRAQNKIFSSHINLYAGLFKSFGVFQFSARFVTLNYFNTMTELGVPLRGIQEKKLIGSYGVFLNTSLTVWGFRIPKFIDFHAGMFIDMSITPGLDITSDIQDIFNATAGVEVIVYALFSKSLFLRASLGYDMRELWKYRRYDGDHYELTIGLGHFF